jgi:hypothetical protein|tara:strand:+ start:306 stop:473 length:168 start_codon:yes stop_codon:yes gene_type:complete
MSFGGHGMPSDWFDHFGKKEINAPLSRVMLERKTTTVPRTSKTDAAARKGHDTRL